MSQVSRSFGPTAGDGDGERARRRGRRGRRASRPARSGAARGQGSPRARGACGMLTRTGRRVKYPERRTARPRGQPRPRTRPRPRRRPDLVQSAVARFHAGRARMRWTKASAAGSPSRPARNFPYERIAATTTSATRARPRAGSRGPRARRRLPSPQRGTSPSPRRASPIALRLRLLVLGAERPERRLELGEREQSHWYASARPVEPGGERSFPSP